MRSIAFSERLRVSAVRMAECLESELHVLEHSEPGKQREALEHHRDALGGARHDLAEVVHLTARRHLEARDGSQQGGLPGTRATEETDDLAGAQCEVHVLEHDELIAVRLPEGLADALHIEQGRRDSSHEDVHRSSCSFGICARRAHNRGRQNSRLITHDEQLITTIPSDGAPEIAGVVASADVGAEACGLECSLPQSQAPTRRWRSTSRPMP
jgi:hypothetical protein